MKNLKRVLFRSSMIAALALGFTGCANMPQSPDFALDCVPAPDGREQKYRITLQQAGMADLQYLVVNQWLADGLTSIGVNPVGVKLYFSTWQSDILKIKNNPAYSDIDFRSVLQGIALAPDFMAAGHHCALTQQSVQKQNHTQRQVFVGGELMFTYDPVDAGKQHFLIHNNQNHVLFERL